MKDLAKSLQKYGQLEPCICYFDENEYYILCGGKSVKAIEKNYIERKGDGYLEIKILDSKPKNNMEK